MGTRRSVIAVVTCAVIVVPAASCASERNSDPPVNVSGVGIVAEGCSPAGQLASGVVVDRPGQVVTVAHAIAGATSISVVDQTGDIHAATVRAFDKNRDLAVLDVPGLDVPALDLVASDVGPAATLTWNRDLGVSYREVTVSKRLTVTIEDIYVEEVTTRQGIEVHGDIGPGDSGGAVLSSSGDVVGIIYAQSRTREGVGFATDQFELDAMLRSWSSSSVTTSRCT